MLIVNAAGYRVGGLGSFTRHANQTIKRDDVLAANALPATQLAGHGVIKFGDKNFVDIGHRITSWLAAVRGRWNSHSLSTRAKSLSSLFVSIALTAACVPPPKFIPQSTPIPHVGLNAWPSELTPVYLQKFLALGANTLRVPVTSRAQADDVLKAVEGSSLSVLLLVEKPDLDLVAALADLRHPQYVAIELGNEVELQGVSSADFAAFVRRSVDLLALGGGRLRVISGGIYTVGRDTLTYAAPALGQTPCSVLFGVHLYGDSSDDILAQLQTAAGCHPIAVTEFGQPSRTPEQDRAQAIYLHEQLTAFQRLGAQYALIYQCCSAPDASNLSNFGLLRSDLSLKGFTFP